MDWFRWHHGTVTDPKWRVVSAESGQPLAAVLAVWAAMLEHASENEARGSLAGWRDKVVAAALDLAPEAVQAIREAMEGMVIDGDDLPGWKRRQPKREDDSSDRVRAHRSRSREEVKRDVTQRNASEESREEKNRLEQKQPAVACAPEPEPAREAIPEPARPAAATARDDSWMAHRDECVAFVTAQGYGHTERMMAAGEDKPAWQDPKTGAQVPWPDRIQLLRLADARVQDKKSSTLRSALNYVRPQQLDPIPDRTAGEFAANRPAAGTEAARVLASARDRDSGAGRVHQPHAATGPQLVQVDPLEVGRADREERARKIAALPAEQQKQLREEARRKAGPKASADTVEGVFQGLALKAAAAHEKHHGGGVRISA